MQANLPQLVTQRYWETGDTSVGPMNISTRIVVMDDAAKAWLDRQVHEVSLVGAACGRSPPCWWAWTARR